jgi:hypothetical protein
MNNKNEGRKVEFYEFVRKKRMKNGVESFHNEKELSGSATFLTFGMEVLEYEMSFASYSTAIIELEDGSVKSVPVENIVFKNSESIIKYSLEDLKLKSKIASGLELDLIAETLTKSHPIKIKRMVALEGGEPDKEFRIRIINLLDYYFKK